MTFDLEPLVWIKEEVKITGAADRHNVIVEELKKIGLSNRLLLNTRKGGEKNQEMLPLDKPDSVSVEVQYAEKIDAFQLDGYQWTVPAGTKRLCLVVRKWKQAEEQAILLAPPILCRKLVLKVGTYGEAVAERVTAGVGIQAGYDSIESRGEPGTLASSSCVGNFADTFETGAWVAKKGQCFAPVDSVVCRLGLKREPSAVPHISGASGGG